MSTLFFTCYNWYWLELRISIFYLVGNKDPDQEVQLVVLNQYSVWTWFRSQLMSSINCYAAVFGIVHPEAHFL